MKLPFNILSLLWWSLWCCSERPTRYFIIYNVLIYIVLQFDITNHANDTHFYRVYQCILCYSRNHAIESKVRCHVGLVGWSDDLHTQDWFNPLTAKLFNLNFHWLEVLSRWRDPQLQVSENYSDLAKWKSTVFKYCWLMSHFFFVTCLKCGT